MARIFQLFLLLACLVGTPAAHAEKLIVVPRGNRFETQPPIPSASANRTAAFKTTYEEKYQKIVALLKHEAKLRAHIKQVTAVYGIDPIHLVG